MLASRTVGRELRAQNSKNLRDNRTSPPLSHPRVTLSSGTHPNWPPVLNKRTQSVAHSRILFFSLSRQQIPLDQNVCDNTTCPDIWADKSEDCLQIGQWPSIITQCDCVRSLQIAPLVGTEMLILFIAPVRQLCPRWQDIMPPNVRTILLYFRKHFRITGVHTQWHKMAMLIRYPRSISSSQCYHHAGSLTYHDQRKHWNMAKEAG